MENDGREKAYRFVAYTAVTFSVVAIISVCVTLPMLCNYVNHLQDMVREEAQYCKLSAKEIMNEIGEFKSLDIQHVARNRTIAKRQAPGCESKC